jgi:hypothetical protein
VIIGGINPRYHKRVQNTAFCQKATQSERTHNKFVTYFVSCDPLSGTGSAGTINIALHPTLLEWLNNNAVGATYAAYLVCMNTHTKTYDTIVFCTCHEIRQCVVHEMFRFVRIVALRVAEYNRLTPIHTHTVSFSGDVNAFLVSSLNMNRNYRNLVAAVGRAL